MKEKNWKRKVLACILYIIFFGSILLAVGYYYRFYRNRRTSDVMLKDMATHMEEQQKEVHKVAIDIIRQSEKENSIRKKKKQKSQPKEEKSSYLDMHDLQKINSDIYAWIEIPDTIVNYPVLHHSQNDYYLMHNVDHSSGYPGCIYSDAANTLDFSDQITVLYGHNMKNESMFGSLYHFREEAFFKKNPYIYIYTEDTVKVYEVMLVTQWENQNVLHTYNKDSKEDKERFINKAKETAIHARESKVDHDKGLLILSTCIRGNKGKRLLIVSREL